MPTPFAPTRYSFFILCVELVGASALWPYAAANIRAVLPAKDPRKWSAQAPEEKYREFGCVTPFDVFVLVPCYKVRARTGRFGSWALPWSVWCDVDDQQRETLYAASSLFRGTVPGR